MSNPSPSRMPWTPFKNALDVLTSPTISTGCGFGCVYLPPHHVSLVPIDMYEESYSSSWLGLKRNPPWIQAHKMTTKKDQQSQGKTSHERQLVDFAADYA